ncbi:protein MpSUVHa [Marchantia polymorpha subsp. ruderalis]|uniref:SET domain-containing protein n=2 Tax=Marchantia polymorpha TaxID=3197 RepID=A0A176VX66_MARPO|nr:hypothetical protein AXG93_2016s1500 [Marchantia polymorpha subsp. ruderalis]PTQ48017.1 hypothetical protein MARPO_0006s0057 [Marchantia polymorpha]BBN04580.1 hypothetical protein Mp_3g05860 [Marchantia polymorpha subsp. ruderalis]|eukprot:PTQ48017.1 hypothetical protein MARPO_0006s0057 [Marchantia polymorpha]
MAGHAPGSEPVGDENVDIESVSPTRVVSPAATGVKKMRGSIERKDGELHIGCYRSRPKIFASKPARQPRTATAKKQKTSIDDPRNWAIVVYKPPPFPLSTPKAVQEGKARKRLPKPYAVRDAIPGMRIRGCRAAPVPERPAAALEKLQKRTDPVTVLSDSESERDEAEARRTLAKKVQAELSVVRVAASAGRFGGAGPGRFEASTSKSAEKKKQVMKRSQSNNTQDEQHKYSSTDPRTRVKEVLEKFDNLRRHFLREEEHHGKSVEKGTSKRADLRASSILMDKGYRVNGMESILGEVPGVKVGDHFYYRMELLIISLHRQSQGGIDFIPASKSTILDKRGNPLAVAVSVIASGGYEDDHDEGETLIYTGQGGNNYKGDKRNVTDQELVRGNLALKNCCDLGLAVRVIRGSEVKKTGSASSPSGKIYYYDGLYDVKECYQETGSAGYKVWKYKLVRRPGQGPLSTDMGLSNRVSSLPPILATRGEKVLMEDISLGKESVKVRVVGREGVELPEKFQYMVKMKYPVGVKLQPAKVCSCTSLCWDKCFCLKWNHGEPPYNESGSLVRGKKAIFECGPKCSCKSDCYNRVSQKGIRYDLEVFKTEGKGWGVRSSNFIPQGSFICEYIGEVVHTSEAEQRVTSDDYLFDLNVPQSQSKRFGDVSGLVEDVSDSGDESEKDYKTYDSWTIDARQYGNVARFINHSCDGNLFVQCVFYEHHDMRFPHIMLFAMEKISPFKELTYDYGEEPVMKGPQAL